MISQRDRIEFVHSFLRISPLKSATAEPRSKSTPARVQLISQSKREIDESACVHLQIESLNALRQCSQAAAKAKLASHSSTVLHSCKVERLARLQVELPHGFCSECSDGSSSHKARALHKSGQSTVQLNPNRINTMRVANGHSSDTCETSFKWMTQEYVTLPPCPSVSGTTPKLWQFVREGHLDIEQDEVGITTAMLQNIPYKYKGTELAEELDALGMMATYDLLYLPVKMRRHAERNLGYAFVNLRSTQLFNKFAQALHHYRFTKHSSARIAPTKVSRASIQGLAANLSSLMRHWKSDAPPPGLILFDFDAVAG